jgi:protein-S-isoprenylcysteine O-methyltransferase Ste14
MKLLSSLLVLCTPGSNLAHSFVHHSAVSSPPFVQKQHHSTTVRLSAFPPNPLCSIAQLRGGGTITTATTTAMEIITQAINHAVTSNNPFGTLGLWAVASSVVIPLTLYRQGYAFSVGYGFSVAAMALYLIKQFPAATPNPLAWSAAFQGVRLATYLLLRQWSSPEKAQQVKSFDKSPPWRRIPFAASVSLFYAFLMTPVMYMLRSENLSANNIVLNTGAFLAWAGAILETVADYHKFFVKQNSKTKKNKFAGPTSGVYRITRHPNYTGEVLFWLGIFVGGMPFFGKGSIGNIVVGWVSSGLGFYGIYSIMTMATKRLDDRQKENYKGQKTYDTWRSKVKPPIFPFINVD